jgi:hypothetical protein
MFQGHLVFHRHQPIDARSPQSSAARTPRRPQFGVLTKTNSNDQVSCRHVLLPPFESVRACSPAQDWQLSKKLCHARIARSFVFGFCHHPDDEGSHSGGCPEWLVVRGPYRFKRRFVSPWALPSLRCGVEVPPPQRALSARVHRCGIRQPACRFRRLRAV